MKISLGQFALMSKFGGLRLFKSFEDIRKENEELKKMLAEFNKGLRGDVSKKYNPSLKEEMNLNSGKESIWIGKGFF